MTIDLTTWLNQHLFWWVDPSNPTGTIILGTIGSLIATAIVALGVFVASKIAGKVRSRKLDPKNRSKRYLKRLIARARLCNYWQSANVTTKIHFVSIRILIAFTLSSAFMISLGYVSLSYIAEMHQQAEPQNIVNAFNGMRSGVGVFQFQQYNFLSTALPFVTAVISGLIATASLVIIKLNTLQIADLEDKTALLTLINALRKTHGLTELTYESPELVAGRSMLYP